MNIKGHTKVILTDVHTGEQEIHEDDNMVTNAIAKYFANCGLMNTPNLNQSTMTEELLGGVMAFSEEITENANTVTVPSGNTMVANGSFEVVNNGNPTELGSYNSAESGWQDDGRFVQTYDFSTSQGNGTISCICLTGKDMGYIGIGNVTSNTSHSVLRDISNDKGSNIDYDFNSYGYPCAPSLSDSSVYTVDLSDLENGNITIRKFRMPATKLNLRMRISGLVKLSEYTISAPQNMVSLRNDLWITADSEKMYIWNTPKSSSAVWGENYTQYLWEVNPSARTVAESTLINTSGDTLPGIMNMIVISNDIIFIPGYYRGTWYADSSHIYQLNRNTGVISKTENPYGNESATGTWVESLNSANFRTAYSTNNGIVYLGRANEIYTYDITLKRVAPTNGRGLYITGGYWSEFIPTDNPLIELHSYRWNDNQPTVYLLRKQNYIATINNLATPIVKTSDKTMKIVYSLTFTDS